MRLLGEILVTGRISVITDEMSSAFSHGVARLLQSRAVAKKPRTRTTNREPVPPGDDVGAADLGFRVAENVRTLRRSRGLSLDELARASGVSRAALSQIETNKVNPTIGLLWK